MFSYLTPEMINLINENRNKNIPTFDEYFNKKYLEECKVFFENPRISIKTMMYMSYLRETVKNRCLKEYKQKYPWISIENQKKIIEKPDTFEKDFVILDKSLDSNIDEENNEYKDTQNVPLRRSKRLQNKN